MRVAITGAKGQLGRELVRVFRAEHQVLPLDLPEADVTAAALVSRLADWKPHLVIHAAAMTNVDGCALEPDLAFKANALGTRNVALGCQLADAEMVYVSTNEVFDGAREASYLEFDQPNPINAYGRSKLAGEDFVRMLLQRFYIVRTSWTFGHGGNHFVEKILRLAGEQGHLRVVTDEISTPTYVPDLVRAIRHLVETHVYGVYHLVNEGQCSRFDYARRILELAGLTTVEVEPILLRDFTRASTPPPHAVLRNFCASALGISLKAWDEGLVEYMSSRRQS